MNSRWPKFDKKKHIVDQVNFLDLFSAQFSVRKKNYWKKKLKEQKDNYIYLIFFKIEAHQSISIGFGLFAIPHFSLVKKKLGWMLGMIFKKLRSFCYSLSSQFKISIKFLRKE